MSYLTTYTGQHYYPLDPRPSMVRVEDIAHALALQCRFAGHVREFYSVAQHSVLVSRHVPPEMAALGLLHDAAEAYLNDIITPVKDHLLGYHEVELLNQAVILDALGVDPQQPLVPLAVKQADRRALVTEMRDLMPAECTYGWMADWEPFAEEIVPLPPAMAERLFLSRWEELAG